MSISRQENATLIDHLKTVEREIIIEGNDQRATIAVVHLRYIPLLIEKMRKLDQYEKEAEKNGKAATGATKDTVGDHLHLPLPRTRHESGHKTMRMRLIPD